MKNKILVKKIVKKENEFSNKSKEELIKLLSDKQNIVNIMASIREIIYRVTDLKLYPVQILGALELYDGHIIEMKTGEGKTVVALAASLLKVAMGKKVHIITVNEYLTERDATFAMPVYEYINKYCDFILATTKNKKEIYDNADLLYITNSELGFDYLRSNGCYNPEEIVFNNDGVFAIIDEADSILIDEAKIPLIISLPKNIELENYKKAQYFVKTLKKEDYEIDMKERIVSLTESGAKKCQKYFNLDNYANIESNTVRHLVDEALIANFIMKKDIDYIIQNNEIKLIDSNTGRIAEGRRFNRGLHQALEAKENKEIQAENATVGSITYQKLFKMYEDFAGMTGTAMTEKEEFKEIYNKKPVAIPSNKPLIRIDAQDLIFSNNKYRDNYLINKLQENKNIGQPILIGTSSIVESERIAKLLKNNGFKFNLLNAKNDKNEADIIARAGEKGAITIATNMAGRGTDIKLSEGVKELGGLMILGIGHYDFERIDNQLRGRAGRQGDPGFSQFLVSVEDKIIDTFAGDALKKLIINLADETGYAKNKGFSKGINKAQNAIATSYFNSRKSTTEYDDILGLYRNMFYDDRMKILTEKSVEEIIDNFTDNKQIKAKLLLKVKNNIKKYVLAVMDSNWINFLTISEDLKVESNYNSYTGTKSIILYENELGKAYNEMLQNIYKTISEEFKRI